MNVPQRVLSVVIPVRNHAGPLRRLLENLKRQKHPPGWTVEVIVVDNCSTDNTADVIRQSGFRYLRCETAGSGAARNAGVKAARGPIIYFIDADACPVYDDHFVRLIGIAARVGRAGAFGGPIVLPRNQLWNPIAIGDHWACWFNWHPKRRPQVTTLFQPGLSLAVSRAAFDAVGGFDATVAVFEDMEFQNRLLRRGLPIVFAPALPVTHEARGSLSRSWRHSWSWGGPFRTRYLSESPEYGLKYPLGHPRFAWNLLRIYLRRMRRVSRSAWINSKWQAAICFPFLAATVFVWALAVIWGRDEEASSSRSPI